MTLWNSQARHRQSATRKGDTRRRFKARLAVELLETRELLSVFTPGNLVVERVGTGTGALSTSSAAVFLDEYTTSTGQATPVQSVAMPTANAGSAHAFTEGGTATNDGLLADSFDGHFLVLAGYNAAPGVATITSTASATTARVVARVGSDPATLLDTSTLITDGYNTNPIRAAYTVDDTHFYTSGQGASAELNGSGTGGVRYVTLGSTGSSVSISSAPNNTRSLLDYNGQLWVDGSVGSTVTPPSPSVDGPAAVGVGLPTTSSTVVNQPGFQVSSGGFPSPNEFFFASPTTVYTADDRTTNGNAGMDKWVFNGSVWVQTYTLQFGGSENLTFSAGLTGGTFSLIFNGGTASGISYSTSTATLQAAIQTALNGLSSLGTFGPVSVTATSATVFAVSFPTGAPPAMTVVNGLSGGTTPNLTAGSVSPVGLRGLQADFSGGLPIFYGTTTESNGNRILKLADTGSGFTSALMATAPANTVFRGIAFAPTPVTISSLALGSSAGGAINPNTPVIFTATVTPTGATVPSGTVTFQDNGVTLASGVVALGAGSNVATYTATALGSGTHAITASYSGDVNFTPSFSPTVNQVVNGPVFTSINNTKFTAGTLGNFTVLATGAVSFSLTGAPAGVTITNAGVLSGTLPAVPRTTSSTFTVNATDAGSVTNSQTFTLYDLPAVTTPVPFTPGDLLVERVGDGGTTYGGQGSGSNVAGAAGAVFLDEYKPNGTFVQTVSLPSTGANAIVDGITTATDGMMTLSADGRLLSFTGYNAPAGTATVTGTATGQRINFTGAPTTGTFKLGFGTSTTAAITYSTASATLRSNIQTALGQLANIGTANVAVATSSTATSVLVNFQGSFIGAPQPTMTVALNSLGGGTSPNLVIVSATPRVIATVDGSGTVINNITSLDYTLDNLRSATTVNGKEFWTGGGSDVNSGAVTDQVRYYGAPTGTNLSGTLVDFASVFLINTVNVQLGQLFWGSNTQFLATGQGIYHESAPLPATLSSFTSKDVGQGLGNPEQFAIADLNGDGIVDAGDVMYVADITSSPPNGGLYRYTCTGTNSWLAAPTLIANNFTDVAGLTAKVVNGDVVLYGTRASASVANSSSFDTGIVTLTDPGGTSGGGLSWQQLATPVSFADTGSTASPIQQYRGIAFVPQLPGTTPSNLALTSNPTGPTVLRGVPITLNATLAAQTGFVSFINNSTGQTVATVPIVSGAASFTIPANTLPIGQNTFSVFFGGDNTYQSSTQSLTLNVTATTTTTVVTSNAPLPTVGGSVTLTATLTFVGTDVPTGTITFTDNGLALGTVNSPFTAVNSTTYTAQVTVPVSALQSTNPLTPSLVPGLHAIKAVYSGDTKFTNSSNAIIQSVKGNAFGLGDLLVLRNGDGATPLNNGTGGNIMYVDEFTTAASQSTAVQSFTFPTMDIGTTHALVADSQQSAVGQLSLSGDGQYVFLTGYDISPSTTLGLHTSSSALIPRSVGRIKYDGTVESSVALNDLSDQGAVSGIYSPDGNSFYATGFTSEVRYVANYTPSAAVQSSIQIDNGAASTAQRLTGVGVFGGQLYVASITGGTIKVGLVGTGVPTTPGQNITPLAGIPTGGANVPDSPISFYFTKLNPASTGPDTLYIADDGNNFNNGALTKWTLNAGTGMWSKTDEIDADPNNATTPLPGFYWIQGQTVGTTVNLYVTYGDGGNNQTGILGNLYSVIDAGGYGQPFGSHTVTLLSGVNSTVGPQVDYRGVAFVPEPAATHFTMTGAPATATAGTAVNYTVTALDSNNNPALSYTGTVHFSSNDPYAGLPADVTLANSVGTFSSTLISVGNDTITASDTVTSSISGTATVTVSPAAVSRFTVTAPATAAGGSAFNFTVTAQDAFFNSIPGYTGTVRFASSDHSAILPANATLTGGTGIFSATLKTAGTQTLTVFDTTTATISGRSGNIAVSAAATHFTVGAPASAVAGNVFVFSVTAFDSGNNIATGYTGTVHIASNDGQAVLPTNATLINGIGFFGAVLRTAGNQTLTAADTVTGSISGISAAISVTGIAANHLVVSAPANAVTGIAFNFTVTALDPFNNPAPGYGGSVHFSSTDSGANLPGNSTLTNGVGIFSASLKAPGAQTVTATDTGNSSILGTSGAISSRGLVVASLVPTTTGFVATFDKPFDPTQINLYDNAGSFGAADVLLTGPSAPQISFRGTLLIDSTNQTITFVKTSSFNGAGFNPSTGVLAAGTYTVTFRSAANGFKDALGAPLDGANSGNPAGSNYVATFVVNAPPVVVGVPSFARGPDGAHQVNLPNTATTGIPLNLSTGAGVTQGVFTLQYNSALLTVTGASANASLAGATLSLDAASTPGNAILDFSSPTALAAGVIRLGGLIATVPNSAAAIYRSKALLHFSGASLNGGAISVVGDDAVQILAYFGDASGDGTLSGGDAAAISTVATGTYTNAVTSTLGGFTALQLADPVIIGDLNTNANVDAPDVTLMNSFLSGTSRPQLPAIPAGLTMTPTGPDPSLSLPTALQATPGADVLVPVNIDTARPDGSTGATEAILALKYDPRVFDISAAGVQLGTLTASNGWQLTTVVNAQTGEIGIDLFGASPIQTTAGGSLVTIMMHVRDTAPAGATGLELVNQVNPTCQRVYLTTVADDQGAFILHPAVSSMGTLPGTPGQVMVSTVESMAPSLLTSDQPMAGVGRVLGQVSESTALRSSPVSADLDQVFADLGQMLAQASAFGQMPHLLNAGLADQTTTGVLDQNLLQQIGMAQQDWVTDELAATLQQNADRQAGSMGDALGTDAMVGDKRDLGGLPQS